MFEGSSMLLDVLAIIVAFSAVMLLLSVLVTALSQATQAVLRLRARNLQSGLGNLLSNELATPGDAGRRLAASVLNSPEVSVLRSRRDPTSPLGRALGPFVSWIEPDDLGRALATASASDDEADSSTNQPPNTTELDIESVVEHFRRLNAPLSKRFSVIMRVVAIVWACLVALAFQVSTPQLVARLSTDPEYRQSIVDRSDDILQFGEDALGRLEFADAADAALERLAVNHPDLRDEIEQVDDAEDYPNGPAEDLADLIEDHPDRASVITEFEDLWDEELERQANQALTEARGAVDQLAAISITPWRQGTDFYFANGRLQISNILGVLFTVILLTLGAPFWYNVLRATAGLGDRTASKSDDDQEDGSSTA
ncbi:MAG: hypothetical protein MJB57_12280 [Gemmatimonadetes bacterium]|nr:hypothetical protein [Gemmatimonadota bacterium]